MLNVIFEQIRTGGDRNMGYLVGDRESGTAAFIDPSFQPELFVERAHAQGLKVKWIINTHGHSDHTNGNTQAKALTGAETALFASSATPHDISIQDGQILSLGKIELKFFHTPGHINDHIVIFIPTFKIAMTGDHLFVGKVGGTATEDHALEQYKSLHRLLNELPEETTIWPGHDYSTRPVSTLQLEKETNPFLAAKSFPEFLNIKANWPTFKQKWGLK